MYFLRPLAIDFGEENLRHRIWNADGVALADRSAFIGAGFTEAWWMSGFEAAQEFLLNALANDPSIDKVADAVRTQGASIADPLSLDVMASFAISLGRGAEPVDRLLETIMAISFETLREPGTKHMRYDSGGMASALNSTLTIGSERYLNVRWRLRQFVEWANSVNARRHACHVDVAAEIEAVFGMSYEDMIAAVETLHELNDFDVMRYRGTALFGPRELEHRDREGMVRRLLARVTTNRQEFSDEVLAVPLHELRNELVRILLSRPVVGLDDERYLVPSTRMLDNLSSMGWVYALSGARRYESDQRSSAFWTFFGAFYESYIADIFRRVAHHCGSDFWPEQKLGDIKTADIIVRHRNELQVIEVVSGRPSAALLAQPDNENQVAREMERLVFEKVAQLASNIRRYRVGDFAAFGLEPDAGLVIYPVLVQYKSFLRTAEFHNEVQERFFAGIGEVGNIQEVEILDAELVEGLEEHLSAECTLGALIDQKLADVATRHDIFKNFLSLRHPGMPLRFAPRVQEADRAWQQRIAERVKTWRTA